jgi:hypothetical protein
VGAEYSVLPADQPIHRVGEDCLARSVRFVLLRRGEDLVARHRRSAGGRAQFGGPARRRRADAVGDDCSVRVRAFAANLVCLSQPPAPGSPGADRPRLWGAARTDADSANSRVQAGRRREPRGAQRRTQRRGGGTVPAVAPIGVHAVEGSRARARIPDRAGLSKPIAGRGVPDRERAPRISCLPGETEYSAPTGTRDSNPRRGSLLRGVGWSLPRETESAPSRPAPTAPVAGQGESPDLERP